MSESQEPQTTESAERRPYDSTNTIHFDEPGLIPIKKLAAQSSSENRSNPFSVYDADGVNRFGAEVVHKGKRYPVFYSFGPVTDALFVEYDKQRDARVASDGQGGLDSKNSNYDAALTLGRALLIKVEGWGPEDGSKVKDRQLVAAVNDGLLACVVDQQTLPLGNADEDEPWNDDEDASNVYPLRTLFCGREVVTKHTLSDPDADQNKRWTDLIARTKLKPGERIGKRDVQLPSRTKAIGKLYDEMCISHEGYAGRVPLYHKVEVMEAHMSVQQELIDEGNS